MAALRTGRMVSMPFLWIFSDAGLGGVRFMGKGLGDFGEKS